jgi:ribosomal protein L11 methyltransferase
LGKSWPAIDVQTASSDLLLALIDDYGPTAVEERDASVRIFFPTPTARDRALQVVTTTAPVTAVDVPDEDWARRSQENLQPVTVGGLTIVPNSTFHIPNSLVIAPSMGSGTGHHVTTRLCLEAMQTIDVTDAAVLDIGTGSGVLAIAADRLGASRAIGIDNDPDAIQSARENLALNAHARQVEFQVADLNSQALPPADIVTANLTGALLVRSAATLRSAVRSGGMLILSGLLTDERDDVVRAFAPAAVVWEREEEGWVGLLMKKP